MVHDHGLLADPRKTRQRRRAYRRRRCHVFLCLFGAGVIGGRRFPRVALRPAGAGLRCTRGYRPRPRWGRGLGWWCGVWRRWRPARFRSGLVEAGREGGDGLDRVGVEVRAVPLTCFAWGETVLSPPTPACGERGRGGPARLRSGLVGAGANCAWWTGILAGGGAWGSVRRGGVRFARTPQIGPYRPRGLGHLSPLHREKRRSGGITSWRP